MEEPLFDKEEAVWANPLDSVSDKQYVCDTLIDRLGKLLLFFKSFCHSLTVWPAWWIELSSPVPANGHCIELGQQKDLHLLGGLSLHVIAWATAQAVIIIIINPLTVRVGGAPQMILQPVFSIFPCSPLPSGTCWTPGPSIRWCCLPTSSFVRLVFFPLSLCLARWFWPDLMNGKYDHTTAVCVFFTIARRSSCGPVACWIFARTSSLVTWSLLVAWCILYVKRDVYWEG